MQTKLKQYTGVSRLLGLNQNVIFEGLKRSLTVLCLICSGHYKFLLNKPGFYAAEIKRIRSMKIYLSISKKQSKNRSYFIDLSGIINKYNKIMHICSFALF